MAYTHLEKHRRQWSWLLKQKMLQSQVNCNDKISHCDDFKIEIVMDHCMKKTMCDLQSTHDHLAKQIETFFTGDKNADILIQWKFGTMCMFRNLLDEHIQAVKKYCITLSHIRKSEMQVEKMQRTCHKSLQRINAEYLTKDNCTPEQTEKIFDRQWQEWLHHLSRENKVQYISDENIDASIVEILENILSTHGDVAIQRFHQAPLANSEGILKLGVVPTVHLSSSRSEDVCTANTLTRQYLDEAAENIEMVKYRLQNDTAIAYDILTRLITSVQNHNNKIKVVFAFTPEYFADISVIVANFAARKLKAVNDPIEFFKRLKPMFFNTFKSHFTAASKDKTAADNLCSLLATSIHSALMDSLRFEIVRDMRFLYRCMANKKNFKIKILEDLAKQRSFSQYTLFLTNASASFRNWAKVYVEEHCNTVVGGETKLVKMAQNSLATIIHGITATVRHLESKYKKESECDDNYDGRPVDVHVQMWLHNFYTEIKGKLPLDFETTKQMIGVKRLSSISMFTVILLENLQNEERAIITEYKDQNSTSAKVTEWNQPPHIVLYKFLIGCEEQCPFCGELCERIDKNHTEKGIPHRRSHRPQCLGGKSSKTLTLDLCTPPPCTVPLYWQWFCATFKSEIEEWAGSYPTSIPLVWYEVSMEDAIRSLNL